jgi:hypothetical protein
MPAMAVGHQPNHAPLAVNGVHNPKPADTILPQAVKFTQKRLPTFRVVRNATNSPLDGTFQIRKERVDHLSHMRRDIGTEEIHAVRRFFTEVNGSRNTSSKVRPFLPLP